MVTRSQTSGKVQGVTLCAGKSHPSQKVIQRLKLQGRLPKLRVSKDFCTRQMFALGSRIRVVNAVFFGIAPTLSHNSGLNAPIKLKKKSF